MKPYAKETRIVHGLHTSHVTSMDLVEPIHMTSTFKFKNADHGADLFAGKTDGYIYTRVGNPTVALFEEKMADLEEGEAAIATASGMAAVSLIALTLAGPGDNFVSCNTVYGGTYALFQNDLKRMNMTARFLTPSEYGQRERIEGLIDENTRFLYLETPANPTIDIVDIRLWSDIAHANKILLVVDNTFASPWLQNPLVIGADIVLHSTTKYIGGHGDIIGGVVIGTADMMDRIRTETALHFGPSMSPFNAWLFLRGLKTLALRMEKHCENAMKIANWLDVHPKVDHVYYPGLPAHPGHTVAAKQMKNFGGMIAFEIKGGIAGGKQVMDRVKLCTLAVSLGDCDTLIQHPASMTHAAYPPQDRQKAGISDGLIRLSAGIEATDDIIRDLDQAMA